jgi:carbon monoxide dehydrogenase subunit G
VRLAKIEQSIEIAVPPPQVWAYITDPQNFLRWSGTLDHLELIHETSNGVGTRARATIGQMTVIIEVIELVENQKLVAQAIGGDFKSFKQAFQLEARNAHTQLTYILNYRVPYLLGGPIFDWLLVRRTLEEEMAKNLTRVKQQLEHAWYLFSNAQRR